VELDAFFGITAARLEALRLHALVSDTHHAHLQRRKNAGRHPPDAAWLAAGAEGPGVPGLLELQGRDRYRDAVPDAVIGGRVRLELTRARSAHAHQQYRGDPGHPADERASAPGFIRQLTHENPPRMELRVFAHRAMAPRSGS